MWTHWDYIIKQDFSDVFVGHCYEKKKKLKDKLPTIFFFLFFPHQPQELEQLTHICLLRCLRCCVWPCGRCPPTLSSRFHPHPPPRRLSHRTYSAWCDWWSSLLKKKKESSLKEWKSQQEKVIYNMCKEKKNNHIHWVSIGTTKVGYLCKINKD